MAQRAGVSLGTVSNVMNSPERVRPETRLRVEAAMQELNFVGSVFARQFRRGQSETVGVLVPDFNPFWADVLRGIEDTLQVNNLALFVSSTRQDPGRARRAIAAFERQQVDGLLLAPSSVTPERLKPFRGRPLGVVTVDGRLPRSGIPSVALDDVRGGYMVAAHLLAVGHRSVVLVNGPSTVSWCRDRAKGVRLALADAGLDPAEALLEVRVHELTVDEGIGSAERILQQPAPMTAVACANDLLALGVLIGLRRRGLESPRDYALAGFDDVDFAAALSPSLTSVRQPARAMGTAAAQLLLQQQGRARHIQFEPELVVRESTRLPGAPDPDVLQDGRWHDHEADGVWTRISQDGVFHLQHRQNG